jgi:hypothetical protein
MIMCFIARHKAVWEEKVRRGGLKAFERGVREQGAREA